MAGSGAAGPAQSAPPGLALPSELCSSATAAPMMEGSPQICLPGFFLSEFLETAILQHFEVLHARDQLGGPAGGVAFSLRPKGCWTGWAVMAATLAGLAVQPSAEDP
jgi:hypothetical protein